MSWEIGKSYRLVDVDGFVQRISSNEAIYNKIHENIFKVTALDSSGWVTEIEKNGKKFNCNELNWVALLTVNERIFFEEVTTKTEFTGVPVYDNPVAEWLEKLNFVLQNDPFVQGIFWNSIINKVYIATEFGDINGTPPEIVQFIENKHEDLFKAIQAESKKELTQKRLQLLEELSKIDQELNRYGE